MADAQNQQLKPYAPIPPEEPANPDPRRIHADNQGMRQAMQAQFGTGTGQKWKDPYGNVWTIRNVGDPKNPTETYVRPDPADPTRFIVWPKGGQQQAGVKPGGDYYYDQVQALRNELSANGGENPLTGKQWDQDPATADYGTLRSMQQILHRSTFQPVDTHTVEALNAANDVRGLLQDVQDDYKAAGGKAGLNKWQQVVQGLKTTTDINNFANDDSDPQRAAYLKLMRDLSNLKDAGTNVTKLSGEGASGAILDGINGVLQEGGILHPLLSALGVGVTGALNAVKNGDFQNDALRYLTPLAQARTDRLIYGTISNMTNPAAKTLVRQDLRDMGTAAADDLYGNLKIGDGMDVAKVRPIPEPDHSGTQQPQPTATPTPSPAPIASVPGAQSPTATPTPAPENLGAKIRRNDVVGNLLGQGWDAIKNWGQGDMGNPNASQTALPKAPITPTGVTPLKVTPLKVPSIMGTEEPNSNETPTASPSPTPKEVRPWWNPSPNFLYSNTEDNLPVAQSQEHLDSMGLEPGTPFKWQDGETYVKT